MANYLVIVYGQECGDDWVPPQKCVRLYAERESDTEMYYELNGRNYYLYIYQNSAYVQYEVEREDAFISTYWMDEDQQDKSAKVERDRTDIVTDYRKAWKNIGLDMEEMVKTKYAKNPV